MPLKMLDIFPWDTIVKFSLPYGSMVVPPYPVKSPQYLIITLFTVGYITREEIFK